MPDEEVYASLRPAMATLPQSMLVAISSPYRKSGLLFKKFRDHYGKDGDILVVHAPSKTLNPTLNQSIIDAAFADDPALAAAEWNAEWRNDLEGYVSFEVVRGCVGDHVEMAPLAKDRYFAFVDPAGGSGQDGFTAAISRRDGERVVIDAIRETRPPFSPESVIDDLCNNCLKSHNGPSFLNSVHV